MAQPTPRTVLRSVRTRALSCLVTAATAVVWSVVSAEAQPAARRNFSGGLVGAEVGRLNVIGGSLVDGVDTLSQDTRPAVTVVGGGRYEFGNRLVLGAEVGFGFEDGDLRLEDASQALVVDYRNDRHFRLGGTAGLVLGAARRTLLFGYLSELSRSFDVTVAENGQTMTQQDDQGLLRYGVGLERAIGRWLSLRGTVGSSRAGFGDRQTNIEVTRPIEAAVGLLFRF